MLDQATACATGIAQKTVPLSGLRRMLVPVPPLAEQRRIVAKVEELVALCDRLKAQLTTAQAESRRLLEAVVHEALVPAVYRMRHKIGGQKLATSGRGRRKGSNLTLR